MLSVVFGLTISSCCHDWSVLYSCGTHLPVLQARGPRKHLKRLAAPSSWMLDKLSGTYVRFPPHRVFFPGTTCFQAPRPSPGPHRLRESLPLSIVLRNRLKYALTGREVTSIVQQRLIQVDAKVRTDNTYPTGFMGTILNQDVSLQGLFLGRCALHREVERILPPALRCQGPLCYPPDHC
jgi:hypothetical protein